MRTGGLTSLRLCLLAALLAAAALAVPAAARAAVAPQNVTVTQSTTRANAHADVTVGFDVANASEQLRDLRLHLPAGLIGNPLHATPCAQADLAADSCPAASQVGTTAVTATALGLPTVSPGTVYVVQPSGDEAARLGIVVRPLGGVLGKITLQSPIYVRDGSDYGLDSTVDGIPNTLSGIPITVTHMDLTLSGFAGTGRSFMTNPSSCAPKQVVVEADSYAAPGAFGSGRGSMQSTDCQSAELPATVTATADDPHRDVPSGLRVIVDVPEDLGDHAPSQVRASTLNFPTGLALNPAVAPLLHTCDDASFGPLGAQDQCPAGSQVGTVSFTSPPLGELPARIGRTRISRRRVRLLGTRRIEVRAPHAGKLSLALDRRTVTLSKAGRHRQGDAPATDLDFTAVIGRPGDKERLLATATATYR